MLKHNHLKQKSTSAGRGARRVHGTLFTVVASKGGGEPMATCSVAKRIASKAVERNRIKRLCREALREVVPKLPGGIYVFSAKRDAANATLLAMKAEAKLLAEQLRSA